MKANTRALMLARNGSIASRMIGLPRWEGASIAFGVGYQSRIGRV